MRWPSTRMSSRRASARVPSSRIVVPLTDTRPWVMSVSAARLEATPAAERIFWSRSPVLSSAISHLLSRRIHAWIRLKPDPTRITLLLPGSRTPNPESLIPNPDLN
jgi:hypothetical protein